MLAGRSYFQESPSGSSTSSKERVIEMRSSAALMVVPENGTAEDRAWRELVRRFKERLAFALSLSGKGQNEVAREVGASQSVASDWFDQETDTLPGGKFLVRLPGALGVNGHWLLTGEGHWHPQPASGRKDLLLIQGIEIGARSSIAEIRKAIQAIEKQTDKVVKDATERARDALSDADSERGAGHGRSQGRSRGQR